MTLADLISAAAREAAIPAADADRLLHALTRAAPGETIYIPARTAPERRQRDASILAAHHQGQSLPEIAHHHGITSNRIRQILAAAGVLDR